MSARRSIINVHELMLRRDAAVVGVGMTEAQLRRSTSERVATEAELAALDNFDDINNLLSP